MMTTGLLAAALAAYLWVAPDTTGRLRDLGLRCRSAPSDAEHGGEDHLVGAPGGGPDVGASGGGQAIGGRGRRGSTGTSPGDRTTRSTADTRWWTAPWLSAVVTVLTVSAVVGGVTGIVVGLAAAGAVATLLRYTATASEVRRRARVVSDLPLTVDLLVACVSAGRAPSQALTVVAASTGGPIADELRPVCARLELGADARTVWSELAAHDTLAPLGRALARSARTGSSITSTLSRCAEDLRRDRRAVADADARKVGVRATAPLGACFLPAFFLIGVAPTIVGGIGSMQW